jgi:hypothetical protein
MQARKKLKPGKDGTKSLLRQYGEQLVCVRYRYDEAQQVRHKTVEIIVESTPWQPPAAAVPANTMVGLRIGVQEGALQEKIRQAGGQWQRGRKLWELRYDQALALGLKARIEPPTLPPGQKRRLPNTGKA